MSSRGRRWALLALLGVVACGDPPLLELALVLPDGDDPFAGVEQLRLAVRRVDGEQTVQLEDPASFAIEVELDVASEVSSVVLEGAAGEKLLARGETPSFVLRPVADRFALLVSRAGELSPLVPRLERPAAETAAVWIASRGVLLAGGRSAEGRALDTAALYDAFEHELVSLPGLPEPRVGAVGAACGGSCAVIALGSTGERQASELLRFADGGWQSFADGLDAGARRVGAAIAPLGDGTHIVVGGVGAGGEALASLLRLDPIGVGEPRLDALAATARVARARPAAAGSGALVLAVGGQGAGEEPAEVFSSALGASQALPWSGPSPVEGSAVAALGSGRFAVVGGKDADGVPLADGWLVDGVARTVTHHPGVLSEGRSGHQLRRVGEHLVVIGGRQAGGLAAVAELLATDNLAPIATTPTQQPRTGHVVQAIAEGTLLVAGGAADGAGASLLEVYQTFAPAE